MMLRTLMGLGLTLIVALASAADTGRDIEVDSQGHPVVCGLKGTDGAVVKYNQDGSVAWAMLLTGDAHKLIIDSNDDIFVGYTSNTGPALAKLRGSNGGLIWERRNTLPGAVFADITLGFQESALLACNITVGPPRVFIQSYSSAGTFTWQRYVDDPQVVRMKADQRGVFFTTGSALVLLSRTNGTGIYRKSSDGTYTMEFLELATDVLVGGTIVAPASGTQDIYVDRFIGAQQRRVRLEIPGNQVLSEMSLGNVGDIYLAGSTVIGSGPGSYRDSIVAKVAWQQDFLEWGMIFDGSNDPLDEERVADLKFDFPTQALYFLYELEDRSLSAPTVQKWQLVRISPNSGVSYDKLLGTKAVPQAVAIGGGAVYSTGSFSVSATSPKRIVTYKTHPTFGSIIWARLYP